MKKLLGIMILGLLLSGNAYSKAYDVKVREKNQYGIIILIKSPWTSEFMKSVNAHEKTMEIAIKHCNGLNKDTYAFWSETTDFGAIKKIDYFYSKTISELGIFYPQIILLLILFSGFTNTSINNSIIYIIFSVLFFCLNAIMVNLFFQMFTSFNSRFVQFILIVPIYIGFAILIAPMWLGVNQEISNIYLLMLLGITMIIYSFTNFYLRKSQ